MKNTILLLAAALFTSSIIGQTEINSVNDSKKYASRNEISPITDAEEDEFNEEKGTPRFLPEPMEKGDRFNPTGPSRKNPEMQEVPMVKGDRPNPIRPLGHVTKNPEMQVVPMVKGDRPNPIRPLGHATKNPEMQEVPMVKGDRPNPIRPLGHVTKNPEMQEVPMVKGNRYGKLVEKELDTEVEEVKVTASIYPNPNEGVFTIRFDQVTEVTTKIEIMDMSGRIVYTENLGQYSGNYQEQVDLKEFGAGIYMVAIQHGNSRTVNKIIVR